jgi:hypothetical protein
MFESTCWCRLRSDFPILPAQRGEIAANYIPFMPFIPFMFIPFMPFMSSGIAFGFDDAGTGAPVASTS